MIFADGVKILSELKKKRLIKDADENVAAFLCGFEEDEEKREVIAAVSALLFVWISSGNICITKEVIEKFIKDNPEIAFPNWEKIKNILSQSCCCTRNPENEQKPIVLADGKIYFYKYWLYEDSLAGKVLKLSRHGGHYTERANDIINIFSKLFNDPKSSEQKKAAETVIRNRFSVITGGPGTGKTTTIANMIAGILSICPEERIVLAAPTGKAAARMTDALKSATENIKGLVEEKVFQKMISLEGLTLHRILGMKFGKPEKNRLNPINADLVIVDEASMVDILLFSELLEALSEKTSLILLGDKDQLASVDVGNVFSDICSAAEAGLFDIDIMAVLTTSRRFDVNSGVGKLAKAVNAQRGIDEVVNICREEHDLEFYEVSPATKVKDAVACAVEKYRFLSDENLEPREILEKLNDFKILCPSKEDVFGVDNINREIETALKVDLSDVFYNGRPIMITKNDYANNLMNGDCGVILRREKKTKAWFFQGNEAKSFDISDLSTFETVYATTIHKSQGSEYESVLVIMPKRYMPMLTKELFYTAITRAKTNLGIVSSTEVLENTLKNAADRNSGFKESLEKAKKHS